MIKYINVEDEDYMKVVMYTTPHNPPPQEGGTILSYSIIIKFYIFIYILYNTQLSSYLIIQYIHILSLP